MIKASQKTIEKIADTIAETQANHFKTSNKLFNIINKALNKKNEFNTFVDKVKEGDSDGNFSESIQEFILNSINDKKVLNLVNAFDKLQKAQRQTLGILDKKDKDNIEQKQKQLDHNIATDNKKLELEEKKINNDESSEEKEKAIKEYLKATRPSKEFIDSVFDDD